MKSWAAPDDRFLTLEANHNEWCAAGLHFLGTAEDPSEHRGTNSGGRYCKPCAAARRMKNRKAAK